MRTLLWRIWSARLCIFRQMISGREKRVPVLLSSVGVRTYSLLRDLVAPDAPGSLIFARLSELLSISSQDVW